MKNLALLLMVYSTIVTVFLIAYFLPIKQALGRVFGTMGFSQRFILTFAFFTVVAVLGGLAFLLFLDINVETNLGQIGDFVGGLLNPILSFLALIAIVISISIQERELRSSVDSLRSQEEIFRIQNFESSIFNLLAMQRGRRNEQILTINGKSVSAYKKLVQDIRKRKAEIVEGHGDGFRAHVEAAKYFTPDLRGYDSCALLYQQFYFYVNMVNKSGLTDDQKNYYISLAYSDLSSHEALVLFNLSIVHRWLRKILFKVAHNSFKNEFFLSTYLYRYYSG